MRKFAVPCIISLLVAALYNIVDQIFIANASYLGSYGNAANNVVFPLTVVALSLAVMIGDGCSVVLVVIASIILTTVYIILQNQILAKIKEDDVHLYFTWFDGKSVLPKGTEGSGGQCHMHTWIHAYELETPKEWMFSCKK